MLSATNSVNDVKAELGRPFGAYELADDPAFVGAITLALVNVRRLPMIPRIGEGTYDLIAALDKTDLSRSQGYIYQAEILLASGNFLEKRHAIESEDVDGDSESSSEDGYSRSVSGRGTTSGKKMRSETMQAEANTLLSLAGYSIHIGRGDSMGIARLAS